MHGQLLGAMPKGVHFPFYRPRHCQQQQHEPVGRRGNLIPRILWQTGRGNSIREHNGLNWSEYREQRKLLRRDRMRVVFHNDTAARNFVRRHCPFAAEAYDCLLPHSYKADLWRYCALWTKGGWYLDAEDKLLVPLSELPLRPCDTLMLVNDICPAGYGVSPTKTHSQCQAPVIQISLMAAKPRHQFFRCCLALLIRNVHRRVTGRGTLDVTGPIVAGACFAHYHKWASNVSLAMVLGPVRGEKGAVAIYRADRNESSASDASARPEAAEAVAEEGEEEVASYAFTPVVRVHAWRAHSTKTKTYVDYASAWERKAIFANFSNGSSSTGTSVMPPDGQPSKTSSRWCRIPVDESPRYWVPGSATRLGRFWDMVQ